MPSLHRMGKEKVLNHHHEVPYKVLEKQYTFGDEKNENKIIHGDNLEALKSLLPQYEGKIKCIYIDPPYNTGNEGWVYNDNVNHPKIKKWLHQVVGREGEDLSRHDKWLCMMYPRLKLLHKLLRDDGVIFISIDDNEQANLKLVMDEIFGCDSFIINFTRRRTDNQSNIGNIASVKEYILCYAKNKSKFSFNKISMSEKAKKEYRYQDDKGFFRRDILFHKTRGRHTYDVKTPSGKILTGPWMKTKEQFDVLLENNGIYRSTGKEEQPYGKIYLDESKGQVPNDFLGIELGTNQQASVVITQIFGNRTFDFPKPNTLVEFFIQLNTDSNEGDIILDSFAGSGTTAHAVLNLNKQKSGNRKFILIEMEDYANSVTAERAKRVIEGYGEDTKKVEGTGGGFSYYELGQPLFLDEENLNEEVGEGKLREYIWYTETKTPFTEPKKKNKYFLGTNHDTDYYFFYEKNKATNLNYEFLSSLETKKNKQYVIYADTCLLSEEFMRKHNIIFKKIPRDITRF